MANASEPLMNVGTRFDGIEGVAWRGSDFGFGFGRESGDDKSAGGARAIRGDETLDTHRAGKGLTRQFQSRGKNTKRIPPRLPQLSKLPSPSSSHSAESSTIAGHQRI